MDWVDIRDMFVYKYESIILPITKLVPSTNECCKNSFIKSRHNVCLNNRLLN